LAGTDAGEAQMVGDAEGAVDGRCRYAGEFLGGVELVRDRGRGRRDVPVRVPNQLLDLGTVHQVSTHRPRSSRVSVKRRRTSSGTSSKRKSASSRRSSTATSSSPQHRRHRARCCSTSERSTASTVLSRYLHSWRIAWSQSIIVSTPESSPPG